MKIHKFKGKQRDNSSWIFGELENNYFPEHLVKNIINPNAIYQYIGRKDCHDIEIYEGDICRVVEWVTGYEKDYPYLEKMTTGVVIFDEESLSFVLDCGDNYIPFHEWINFEIIGNIYDKEINFNYGNNKD